MKLLAPVFIFLFFFGPLYSQQTSNLPSIKDTSLVRMLITYANRLSVHDKDSAGVIFQYAENESKSIGDDQLIVDCLYEFGLFYFSQGDFDRAMGKFQQSHDRAALINYDDKFYASKTYIGTVYMLRSNYNAATKYTYDALEYYESEKNYIAMAGIYLNLTYLQIEQNDYDKGVEYADLSYEYAVLAGSDRYICKSLLNIGELAFLKEAYRKSLDHYFKSLRIVDSIDYRSFKSTLFLNIGASYTEMGMLDSAEYFAHRVAEFDSKNDASVFVVPKAYILLSGIFKLKGDYEKSKLYALKAINFSDSVKIRQISGLAYNYLAELAETEGDYKRAYQYKLEVERINDSIFTDEKYRIQNDLEAIYENTKKQKEIEALSKENQIAELKNQRFRYVMYLLAFIVLLSVIIAVLIIRQNRIRSVQQTIELEQKLLRTQMNPHFIFNSVSAIQDFILNNDPIEASSYLSDFAKLMRAILAGSADNFISLNKEIETVEHYLKLQHLRLSDKFSYEIDIADEIDTEEYFVPPMLLQPFIENSIKHGFPEKNNGTGLIKVNYSVNDDFLILETEDNGIGRKKSQTKKRSDHRSRAIEITEQRIRLLSKSYKDQPTFTIYDLEDQFGKPGGTKVSFMIPVKTEIELQER
jgi:hypothetical protein